MVLHRGWECEIPCDVLRSLEQKSITTDTPDRHGGGSLIGNSSLRRRDIPRAVVGPEPYMVSARYCGADKCKARKTRKRDPLILGNRRPIVVHRAISRISSLRPAEPNLIFADVATAGRVDAAERQRVSGGHSLVGGRDHRRS